MAAPKRGWARWGLARLGESGLGGAWLAWASHGERQFQLPAHHAIRPHEDAIDLAHESVLRSVTVLAEGPEPIQMMLAPVLVPVLRIDGLNMVDFETQRPGVTPRAAPPVAFQGGEAGRSPDVLVGPRCPAMIRAELPAV